MKTKIAMLTVVLTLGASSFLWAQAEPRAEKKSLVFQIGADAFGGIAQGGIEFIGGTNASLLYPLTDLVWLGLRPALHYAYEQDSVFEATWLHADLAFQVNVLNDPLRIYLLGAGGYAGVVDGDLYAGIGHGFSALAAVGASWQAQDAWALFVELGFRYAQSSKQETVLDLNDAGKPQCTGSDECLAYLTKEIDRQFDLMVFTINIGFEL